MLTVYRKEIKYMIPIEEFIRLKIQLEAVMTRDMNGDNGIYEVRSQYYDSLHNRDLSDNLSGVMEKRKIRLRIYDPNEETAKLEYKCKSNSDGVKHSIMITKQEAMEMEQHQYEFLLGKDEKLAQQLYVKMMQGCYRPKTIITYKRQAYTYPASNVRISFDTELKATANPYGLFAGKLNLIPILNQDVGIFEVKYDDYIPYPLKALIQNIDKLAESSSKYSKSRLMFLY